MNKLFDKIWEPDVIRKKIVEAYKEGIPGDELTPEDYETMFESNSASTYYWPVSAALNRRALLVLHARVNNGEKLLDVLAFAKDGEYWAKKIYEGNQQIDDVLYYRITGEIPYDIKTLFTKFNYEFREDASINEYGRMSIMRRLVDRLAYFPNKFYGEDDDIKCF